MNGTETGSATLAELCDLISEQVHPVDVPEALYVGLEHVIPGRLRRSGGGIARDVQSHKYAFRRNDILYGKLRPYLDKAILADTDGVCTTELLVLRAKPGVDPRFLACLVHDPDFVEHALTGVTGAHHPRTSWVHIAQFECPRFSYEEQQAIAALLWRVQDLLKVCEDTLEVAQDLKRAAMRELFTRGLRGEPQKETEIGSVPESWEIRDFSEAAVLQRGFDLPVSARRAGDVVVFGSNGPVGTHDAVPPGVSTPTVMVGRSGSVGKVSYCDQRCWPLNTTLFVSDFRGNNPKYVYFWLEHFDLTRFGQGVSVPTLNRNTFASVKVAVPTQDEQREIVAILDAIDRKIELHRKKRAVLEELFKALLHKLMTGEIRVDALDLSALQAHAEPLSPAAEPAV